MDKANTFNKSLVIHTIIWLFTIFGYFIIFTSYLHFLADLQTYLANSYYLQNYIIHGSSVD